MHSSVLILFEDPTTIILSTKNLHIFHKFQNRKSNRWVYLSFFSFSINGRGALGGRQKQPAPISAKNSGFTLV